jgi:hypothetical protein
VKPNKRPNADFVAGQESEDDVVFDTASDSGDSEATDATDATETSGVLTNLIKVEVSKVLNVTWLTLDHSHLLQLVAFDSYVFSLLDCQINGVSSTKEFCDEELVNLWVDGLKKDRSLLKSFASYRIPSGSAFDPLLTAQTFKYYLQILYNACRDH